MKKLGIVVLLTMLAAPVWAQPWPKKPPQIGHLYLKQEYWDYMKEAAKHYNISPFLIQAVCAIESRYDPQARSGRCVGLMQLHKDTAKIYGFNPHNPRENIMGGAAVLAKFYHRYDGDVRKVLRKYNSACTGAYVREVLRAYDQAASLQTSTLAASKHKK